MGFLGPVLLITVPPIRARMGYVSRPEVPTSYPGMFLLIVLSCRADVVVAFAFWAWCVDYISRE